jgi:hypothetical protein
MKPNNYDRTEILIVPKLRFRNGMYGLSRRYLLATCHHEDIFSLGVKT